MESKIFGFIATPFGPLLMLNGRPVPHPREAGNVLKAIDVARDILLDHFKEDDHPMGLETAQRAAVLAVLGRPQPA